MQRGLVGLHPFFEGRLIPLLVIGFPKELAFTCTHCYVGEHAHAGLRGRSES